MTTSTSGPWWIGLDIWVLQDGNYTDVVAGERRQFALEIGYSRTARLAPTTAREPTCRYVGTATTYDVTGRLLRAAASPRDGAFVLDVGVLAYASWMVLDDLDPPAAGTWLTGAVSLSVDPFFYVDELAGLPEMPPLIYTWRVEEIQAADQQGVGWRPVDRTRAWDDAGPYRLRCTLEDVPAVSTMELSGPHSPYGPLA